MSDQKIPSPRIVDKTEFFKAANDKKQKRYKLQRAK